MVGMVVMVGVMGRMVEQQAIVLLVVVRVVYQVGLVFREELQVVVLKAMVSLKPMGLAVLRLGMVAMVHKQGKLSNSEWRRLSTFQPSSFS
ncbi:hypothetical protein AMTR_s00009p00140590 [Amborella trichopoda]|uniref:Uncharacterized protein n=1 Tax=Amborella trichopoda TaxID=13333 RepID=W1NI84_AMBTC|nr:hypothetical protein AMTR_s00009p00140590 [Amborella trichopoda]